MTTRTLAHKLQDAIDDLDKVRADLVDAQEVAAAEETEGETE